MNRYGKTYPLGSSEAMKREPRLDEEYYLRKMVIDYNLSHPSRIGRKYYMRKLQELEDSYLEDSINEQYKD